MEVYSLLTENAIDICKLCFGKISFQNFVVLSPAFFCQKISAILERPSPCPFPFDKNRYFSPTFCMEKSAEFRYIPRPKRLSFQNTSVRFKSGDIPCAVPFCNFQRLGKLRFVYIVSMQKIRRSLVTAAIHTFEIGILLTVQILLPVPGFPAAQLMIRQRYQGIFPDCYLTFGSRCASS